MSTLHARPDTATAVAATRLGAPMIAFAVASSATPLTVAVALVPTAVATTRQTAMAAAFLVVGAMLVLFAPGFVAMAAIDGDLAGVAVWLDMTGPAPAEPALDARNHTVYLYAGSSAAVAFCTTAGWRTSAPLQLPPSGPSMWSMIRPLARATQPTESQIA
ncbi:hypothetical protein [Alloactinosynnema sp. L-07]|uniref:hypothetical protein n=1 Tax=Alloactinosynnema sp. L-07 TaxID=1653480 RepID=UPI00065EF8E8|nr:hypothetical protein [Alloactinosynnema sp. L-07]CRK56901.1 hypothetical protein [Alloactinosynnema sp. L-07]